MAHGMGHGGRMLWTWSRRAKPGAGRTTRETNGNHSTIENLLHKSDSVAIGNFNIRIRQTIDTIQKGSKHAQRDAMCIMCTMFKYVG
jgi:hypothetical protein